MLVSSHGVGVGEAIELARCLGRLPTRGRFLGIEVAEQSSTTERLTDPISAAVDRVIRLAEKQATLFTTGIAP
jgi:hydrogenase maturation protease